MNLVPGAPLISAGGDAHPLRFGHRGRGSSRGIALAVLVHRVQEASLSPAMSVAERDFDEMRWTG